MTQKYYTRSELADILNTSQVTVNSYIKELPNEVIDKHFNSNNQPDDYALEELRQIQIKKNPNYKYLEQIAELEKEKDELIKEQVESKEIIKSVVSNFQTELNGILDLLKENDEMNDFLESEKNNLVPMDNEEYVYLLSQKVNNLEKMSLKFEKNIYKASLLLQNTLNNNLAKML